MNPTDTQPVDSPTDTVPLSSASGATPADPTSGPAPAQLPVQPTPKNKKKLGLIAIVVASVLVILGGSAGAYFGIIVPNKPENVLKQSVEKLTKQDAFTAKGKIDITGPGTSAAVDLNMLHLDGAKKQALVDMNLTISGVKLPVEVRYIDSAAYVRLGDLSTIKNLISAYAGEGMGPAIDAAEKKISNQWVEIDKTLLNTYATDGKCSPDEITTKTQAMLNEAVKTGLDSKQGIYTIKNSSKDTVDGVKVTKLELAIDEAKLVEFGKKVQQLPAAKDLAACSQTAAQGVTEDVSANADQVEIRELNIWVDGSKTMKRFEIKMMATSNDKTTTTVDMTMIKDAPKVEKPDGAKPIMQLYGEVISLFGGDPSTFENLSGSLSL